MHQSQTQPLGARYSENSLPTSFIDYDDSISWSTEPPAEVLIILAFPLGAELEVDNNCWLLGSLKNLAWRYLAYWFPFTQSLISFTALVAYA